MPSNRSMSPPKRRTPRSASSSSLVAPYTTASHVRRLSRVPSTNITPSTSSSHLPRLASHPHFAITPDMEPDLTDYNPSTSSHPDPFLFANYSPPPAAPHPLSSHPMSLPRLGAAVDNLLRVPAKGKAPKPYDSLALFTLFLIFLALFAALLAVLRLVFPSATHQARVHGAAQLASNLKRIDRQLPPLQYWPLPHSSARSPPPPIATNLSLQEAIDRKRRPPARLSVVAACKDRTNFLQTALPSWLAALSRRDEVVLVDWATTPPENVPLAEVVRAASDPRISVVTLIDHIPWALSRAYNLGFALATGEWILKLDCDTYINSPTFLTRHPLPRHADPFFYRFNWAHASDRNEQHLNGVFLARATHLTAIAGYDERITTYGWEDSDLYARLANSSLSTTTTTTMTLRPSSSNSFSSSPPSSATTHDTQRAHLRAQPFAPAALRHIAHDDHLRGRSQRLRMGPVLETQVNAQASEDLPSWSIVGESQRTTFRFHVLSRDARYLSANVIDSPSSLMELVTSTRRDAIVATAVDRVLHDGYGLPWRALADLDQAREHVVRALAAANDPTPENNARRPSDAVLFALLSGAVADRVVSLASALMLASTANRPLFVTWADGCIPVGQQHAHAHDAGSPYAERRPCTVGDFFDVETHTQSQTTQTQSNLQQSHLRTHSESSSNLSRIILQPTMTTTTTQQQQQQRTARAPPVFSLGRWRCHRPLPECAATDPAFRTMHEFTTHDLYSTSSSSSSSSTSTTPTTNSLNTNSHPAQRLHALALAPAPHLLLRMHAALPFHAPAQVGLHVSALRPSAPVRAFLTRALAPHVDVASHTGLYLGPSINSVRAVDAVLHRIDVSHTPFFVTGPHLHMVRYARNKLPSTTQLTKAIEIASEYIDKEQRNYYNKSDAENDDESIISQIRQIAELYMLARCKDVVNDGRPTQAVQAVINAFKATNIDE